MSPKGAYFTRGSGHNQYGGYTEDSEEYQIVLDRLKRKFLRAAAMVPGALIEGPGNREVGLVAVGSTDGAAREAMHILARRGVEVDYMRIRAFPFGKDVEAFLTAHRTVFVIEQNRDAQLRSLLTIETPVEKSKLRSILHYSGLSISSQVIVDGVMAELGEGRRPNVTVVRK